MIFFAKNKKYTFPKILVFSGLTFLGIASFAYLNTNSRSFEIVKNVALFQAAYDLINDQYVDEIEPAKTMKKGLEGMLKNLDPYTNYITESQIEGFKLQRSESAADIGADIFKHSLSQEIVIQKIHEGLAAQKAGLQAGDRIVSVNGEAVKDRSADEVRQILQGQPESTVKIGILRSNSTEIQVFTVQRSKEESKNVPYFDMLNENTGYIKLNMFGQKCASEIESALNTLKENKNLKYLIFDLRDNGGGLLNEAIDILNFFVPKGVMLVSTKGKDTEWKDKEYFTTKTPIDAEIPVIVLVNDHSASASEIVSGNFQDLDRGVILGQRTFGKGLVQQTKQLVYKAMVKLTVSKYFLASGRCIQAIDYSGRYKDGVSKVPDSLRTEFKTMYSKRKVYDGGGVDPDVLTEKPKKANITEALIKNHLIFDYATYYCQQHPLNKNPNADTTTKKIRITDQDFDNFANFLSNKKYDYTTATEEILSKLKQTTSKEKYQQNIPQTLNDIETKIKAEKQKDLVTHKNEIMDLLRHEIASQYFYEKGRVINSLNDDQDVKKALQLFENKEEYTKLLGAKNVINTTTPADNKKGKKDKK